MSTSTPWLLYGANGYTGELIAREAVARGMRPVLAGRSKQKIAKLAAELNCPSAVFDLDDHTALVSTLTQVAAVLHCAGPFSQTAIVDDARLPRDARPLSGHHRRDRRVRAGRERRMAKRSAPASCCVPASASTWCRPIASPLA